MLDVLTQKLQHALEQNIWNYNDSNDSNVLVSPFKDIVIEWTTTGYFEIQRNLISFTDCVIGHTFCLKKNFIESDWTNFRLWYLNGIETGSYRTDVPITRQEIEIDTVMWEYTRWMRPGPGVGKRVPISSNSILDTFYELIEPYSHAISAACKISYDNNIPEIGIRNFVKDDNGLYLVNNVNDNWCYTPERVIAKCIQSGQAYIKEFESLLPTGFQDEWTAKAETKWNSLL